jgi:uncharacterized protein YndB with AHSA1/START domain
MRPEAKHGARAKGATAAVKRGAAPKRTAVSKKAATKKKAAKRPPRVAAKGSSPARRAAAGGRLRSVVAKAEMLIRRPVADVFIAFVDPLITQNFWFTKGSDRLHMGKTVRWEWEMFGFAIDIDVKAVDENRRILIDWPSPDGKPTTVEWTFTARPDRSTFVSIVNSGFRGTDQEIAAQAVGTTEGFTLVLAGAKAFLEQGLTLDFVRDRFPDGLPGH